MKFGYLAIGFLCVVCLVVMPTQAFTAKTLTITLDQNGNAQADMQGVGPIISVRTGLHYQLQAGPSMVLSTTFYPVKFYKSVNQTCNSSLPIPNPIFWPDPLHHRQGFILSGSFSCTDRKPGRVSVTNVG